MDALEIIDLIHKDHCLKCKWVRAVMALDEKEDEPEIMTESHKTQSAPAKLQRKTANKPAIKKSQGKGRHVKRGDGEANRKAILDYLGRHPRSKVKDIASALGLAASAVFWHLKNADGQVQKQGASSKTTWSLASAKPAKAEESQADPDDDEERLECRLCHALCSSPGRLESHMRTVHGRVAA